MKRIIIVLFFFSLLLTFLILLPYSAKLTNALPNAVDPVFYAWNLSHNVQSISHGFRDLLDTNIFYPEGNTLAFSDTLYAQTLFTAPIIYITHNPVLAENLYILFTFPMAALTMFFLSYYVTKHAWGSALSGIFFAFSYPRLAQIGHLPMVSSQWLPLYVLFLLKYLKSGTWKHLLMIFLFFVLSLTSSIYFGVFLMPITAIAVLIEVVTWIQNRSLPTVKQISKTLAVCFIPFAIILVIVLYPYIRLKAEYPDIKRSLEDTGRLSAQFTDYRTILPTSLLSHVGTYRTDINEKPLYPTVSLLALAVLGIVLGWKKQRKHTIFFLLSGLGAFLLSFGPTTNIRIDGFVWPNVRMPYYYLYHINPLLQFIRVPARLSIMVILSLAGLAAIGIANIRNKKTLLLICSLSLALFLTEVWQVQTPSVTIPIGRATPAVYQWLAAQPDNIIIVELPLRPLWRGISMENQIMHTYNETKDQDVFASETYRIYFSDIHHKRMLNGYSGFFPQIYHDQAGLLDNFPTQESIAMLQQRGIRYILIHAWQYTDKSFSDIKRQIAQYPSLTLIHQFNTDYVYELKAITQ